MVVAYFRVLSRHPPGETHKNSDKPLSGQAVTKPRFESCTSKNITDLCLLQNGVIGYDVGNGGIASHILNLGTR